MTSQKLSKFTLTTEPLCMKWNKDMNLTDVTYPVNTVHETRLDLSKYIFSQLSSPPRGPRQQSLWGDDGSEG